MNGVEARENYHITKIMNKTSINEGIDVDIMVQLERLYAPPSVPGLARTLVSNDRVNNC